MEKRATARVAPTFIAISAAVVCGASRRRPLRFLFSSPVPLGVDPARGPKPPYGGAHKRGFQRGNIAIPLWRPFFHGRHDFFPTRERNGVAVPFAHDIYPVKFRFVRGIMSIISGIFIVSFFQKGLFFSGRTGLLLCPNL